jgi:methyltransferase (TIGR00027 family)
VILGAGFDCRAYRLPELSRLTVFEVDHPSTQARKRAVLENVLGRLPTHVRFVVTDFNAGDLERAIAAAGYEPGQPTFFLWEGVTNYLTAAAVDATLRWCAQAAAGEILFTYVHRGVLERPDSFFGTKTLFARLEAMGEKWTFGLEPEELQAYLAARGLRLERDLGAEDYRALCFGTASRAMRGYEFYRIAQARIEPRA